MENIPATADELEIRRYRAAVAELKAAGLFSSFRNDERPSWLETVFQSGRPIEYLPFKQSMISCSLICLPMSLILHVLLFLLKPEPIPVLAFRIALFGLVLPWAITLVARREARRHGLSRWEDLAG